jgi:threonine/homoserine/homoserine lactone efflux protein
MQLGLAIAAAISILGLVILLEESPGLRTGLMVVATAYLLWLAWAIGTSPGGVDSGSQDGAFSSRGAFILGVANPKAYLAFAALFGSFTLLPQSSAFAEGIIKWTLSVAVMLVVDFGWLSLGMLFGRIPLPARGERVLNLMMGAAIVLATLLAWA